VNQEPTSTDAIGLYQYIIVAGAILFPSTTVHAAITKQNATLVDVLQALADGGFDISGLAQLDQDNFAQVIQTLIGQGQSIAALGAYLGSLVDPDYIGPDHGAVQLENLFGPAKALENAIDLHLDTQVRRASLNAKRA
jgi:hypothetical protein